MFLAAISITAVISGLLIACLGVTDALSPHRVDAPEPSEVGSIGRGADSSARGASLTAGPLADWAKGYRNGTCRWARGIATQAAGSECRS